MDAGTGGIERQRAARSAPDPAEHGGAQQVPRPAGARPGGSPPWSSVPKSRRCGIGLDRVLAALTERNHTLSLAGWSADPAWDSGTDEPAADRPMPGSVLRDDTGTDAMAAVLVAIFEEAGESRVVLTRRSDHLRVHRGEVSFPGGRAEPGETPEAACRREAAEEIGLDPASVTVVGRLGSLRTVSSRSAVVPVVGILPGRPSVCPNPAEVARVFDVALADLVAAETLDAATADARSGGKPMVGPGGAGGELLHQVFHEERWPVPGAGPDGHPVYFFELAGETIWGATAAVLVELLTVVLVDFAGGQPVQKPAAGRVSYRSATGRRSSGG